MATCNNPKHANHNHEHGPGCLHTAVRDGDHIDFIHGGLLHHPYGDHVDEHEIEVSDANLNECNPVNDQQLGHEEGHVHGPDAGTKPCLMVGISAILSMGGFIIGMTGTVIIVARWTWSRADGVWGVSLCRSARSDLLQ